MPEAAAMPHSFSTVPPRLVAVGLALALVASGCTSVGPPILARDRFDYSSAVAESWKRQTLLNIVKLRYMDTLVFLDVAQIVSGYQLQTSVSAGGTASIDASTVPTIGSFVNFGAQGSFTDRPTITYTPLTGDQYIRGIVTPLRPEQIFSAILAGWRAEAILLSAVGRLNGLTNQRLGGQLASRAADPQFLRVARLLGRLQESGAVSFRFVDDKAGKVRTIMFFGRGDLTEREHAEIDEVRRLLRLDPETAEFDLVFGPTAASSREIAVQTRSLVQILLEVGGGVEVPAAHLAEGRAWRGLDSPGAEIIEYLAIHSSRERSPNAFVSVPYRDHWFWIDDRDLMTKRNFALLLLLFALADTGEKKGVPLLTIPAQ